MKYELLVNAFSLTVDLEIGTVAVGAVWWLHHVASAWVAQQRVVTLAVFSQTRDEPPLVAVVQLDHRSTPQEGSGHFLITPPVVK